MHTGKNHLPLSTDLQAKLYGGKHVLCTHALSFDKYMIQIEEM